MKFCLPFSLWLRGACMLLTFCAFNALAASEFVGIQSQTWLTAVDGLFYGILSLAFTVNILIWIKSKRNIHGLFAVFIIFSMLFRLSSGHYVHSHVLGSWLEQKGTLDLWLFAGMTSSAILFASRVLCVRDSHPLVERIFNRTAIAMLVMVLPAAIWVEATPNLWSLAIFIFIVFGFYALIRSIRNVYNIRTLKNSLIALAFLFFVVFQWFGTCVMLGLLPDAPINQIFSMLCLIISLTLLQVTLVIQFFDSRNEDLHKQAIQSPLKPQTDSSSNISRYSEQLHEQLMHDFKTPLAIIDSSVQSLEMLESENDPQRMLRYNRIRRAVTRINDLLMRSILTEKNTSNSAEKLPISKLTDKT